MQITTLYETVTNRIIAELEQGAAPWLKPWKTGGGNASLVPANAMTGRTYSGINIPILWDAADRQGFPTQSWLTFRQARERGARIQPGAKGTHVVFTKRLPVQKEEDEEGDSRSTRSMLRAYTLFNVAQVTGLPPELTEPEALPPPTVRLDRAWQFIYGTLADIRHGGERAFYHPRLDFIQMPPFGAFLNPESFYATALHELGHWTAHLSRLNRDLLGRFGDHRYAAEELIAELTSAFLCAHLGITGELRHAGYLDHWLTLLRGDRRAIFTAAAKASQAADYLRALVSPVHTGCTGRK